jgi:hypothetical protein
LHEKLLGHDDVRTLSDLHLLAEVLRSQGKYEAAEEINRRALEGREKVLGVKNSDTLISVYNIAYLLQVKEQYDNVSIFY